MKIVNWEDYTKLLEKLYRDIMLYDFDSIVAIGRGGSMIAAYLASKIGLPFFHTVFVRHVGRGDNMRMVAYDFGEIKELSGNLLVVDDWLCEGRAMNYVISLIPKKATIKTLVMYNRKGSEFKPDFVGEYIDEKERELMFPYDPFV